MQLEVQLDIFKFLSDQLILVILVDTLIFHLGFTMGSAHSYASYLRKCQLQINVKWICCVFLTDTYMWMLAITVFPRLID